jgi:uncharacterized protein YhjY with autotransporter beta-barrel domain
MSPWRRARIAASRIWTGAITLAMAPLLTVAFMLLGSWTNPAYAATSPCGTITGTVASNQQIQLHFDTCSPTGWNGILTNPTNGSIVAGTPTTGDTNTYITYSNNGNGQLSDTFTAKDESNNTITFNITVGAPTSPLTVSPAASSNPTVGQSFTQQMSTTGGTAPYTYVRLTGSLPPGITLSSTGAFGGSATASGSYNFSVKVTDSAATPNTFTKPYQMTVGAATLSVSPGTLPNGMVSIAYSQQMSTSGGIAPYSYTMDTVSFPGGGTPLSISSSGLISGTPTTAGTATFRLVVTDSTAGTPAITTANYSMTIDPLPPPLASPVSLPVAYNSTANPVPLSLSGGAAASVAVPTGPSHGTTAISGTSITYTPTTGYNGSDSFTYTATNAGGTSTPATVSVTMTAPAITISPNGSTLSATTVSAFSQTFSASGGTGPYTYSQTGTLPAGLTFNAGTRTLSGTPTAAGSFPITVSGTDSSTGSAASGSSNYTLNVAAPAIAVLIGATTLQRGVFASQQASASGGSPAYTFSVTSGALPAGLNLDAATGAITGTPSAAGAYSFTLTATDVNGFTGAQAVSGNVGAGAPIAAASSATVAYNSGASSYTIGASLSGGTSTSLNVATGATHGVVTVLSASSFSYTPTTGYAGADSFSYTATNAVGTSGTATVSITVSPPTLSLSPVSSALSGVVGTAFTQTFTASGGVPTYVYAQTGSLPTGVTFNAGSATLSGTPTQAGTFNFTVSVLNDGSSGTGIPFTTSRSYALTVSVPTLGISPSTLTQPQVGISYNQPLSTSGGISPYSYTGTSGTLPDGLTLSSSGLISGTPTTAGAYSFSVTSTDSASFGTTTSYSGTVGAGKPVTAASNATVGYSSSNNSIPASISGGTPTSLSITTTAIHGTASPSGTNAFTYTPTAGYSGTDSFSYTATNAIGTSAVATITVTIGAPTIIITPSATWNATAGTAYSQTLTWSGGSAPYSTISVTGLPTGLTYTTSTTGATIIGTPTQNGSFSVTASATDNTTPTPVTKSQIFTLTVGQAIPVAVTDTATTNANQAVTIPVTVNDTGAITSIAVAGNPAHGTAVVNGLGIVYTPTTNYFGSDSFTYTTTGPGGTSSAATVTVTVAALGVPTSPPQSASVQPGQSVTLHVGAAAANGPITAVAIIGTPASGSAVVGGTDIVYTAAVGFSGNVQFTYTLSNAFGTSAAVTATISAGAVPVAANQSVSGAAGATVSVDLTTGATGGPFTAATLGAINPVAAGTAAIAGGGASYRLNFTSAAAFSGTATVSYTLTNASGTSATATVSITIAARTNAANDVQVKGLVAAHSQSASRFATAQLGNFSRRLESLHGTGWAQSSFGLGFAQPSAPVKPLLARWNEDQVDRVVGSPLQAGMRKVGWPLLSQTSKPVAKPTAAAADGNGLAALPDLPAKPEQTRQELSLWIAGTVDFGQRNANGQQEGFRFTTNGVSMGADYRLSDQLTIGVGTGYSRDRSDIGENGSKSIGQSAVATVYGSLRPTPNIFIDGMFGAGALNFDSTRYVTGDGSFATGQRGGKQLFVALSSGYEFRGDSWMWSPYGKVDLTSTTLAQYTEAAAGNNALTYFKQRVRTSSGTFGLRTEGQYLSRFGMWTPRARIEYRRQFSGAGDAGISYADLGSSGPAYVIRSDDSFTGNWTAGLGMRLLMASGTSLIVDYSSNLNVGQGRYSSILLGINVPLR